MTEKAAIFWQLKSPVHLIVKRIAYCRPKGRQEKDSDSLCCSLGHLSEDSLKELHIILSRSGCFLKESKRKSFLAAAHQGQSVLILQRLLSGLEPLTYGEHLGKED